MVLTYCFVLLACVCIVGTQLAQPSPPCGHELLDAPECLNEVGGQNELVQTMNNAAMVAFKANKTIFITNDGPDIIDDLFAFVNESKEFREAIIDICKKASTVLQCVLQKANATDLQCDFKILSVVANPGDMLHRLVSMEDKIDAAELEPCATLAAALRDN